MTRVDTFGKEMRRCHRKTFLEYLSIYGQYESCLPVRPLFTLPPFHHCTKDSRNARSELRKRLCPQICAPRVPCPTPNAEHLPTRVSLQITKSDLRNPAGTRGAKTAEDFDFAPGPPTPTGPPAKDGQPVSSKTLSALEEGVGAVPSKGAVAPSGIKAGEVVVVGGAANRPQSPRKKDKEGSGLNSPKWWGKKVGFPRLQ
jgi:hypothetical protein